MECVNGETKTGFHSCSNKYLPGNSSKVLGNMSNSYSGQVTTTSDISFSVKADERIKFSFRSHIVSRDLDMALYFFTKALPLFDNEGGELTRPLFLLLI